MNPVRIILLLLLTKLTMQPANAQTCTNLGQKPETAFPVCGTSTFSQSTVAICGNTPVPVPSCQDVLYTDKNPYWYKFTCFQAGTLGFLITPNNLSDDYDWQLFDITGHAPEEVYTNSTLYVASNWSGNPGLTGTNTSGTSLTNCAGFTYPTFSSMPVLKQGHNYLLLISHFTDSQSGYDLSFEGGTAVITDPTPPEISGATASCDGKKITVALNKKMKCSSLAADGSDFSINSTTAKIISATANGCSSGFDMDSVTLVLDRPLSPGNYLLSIKNGTDRNTLADNCGRYIAVGEQVPFEVLGLLPTAMDSLISVGCAPGKLQLYFKNPIQCNSIAPDGSDFFITGTQPVTISGVNGHCKEGLTNTIDILLATPIVREGNFQIQLRTGRDNNTLIDECGLQTPAGATLLFKTKDTVSAIFSYKINYGCKADTIHYTHDGRNGVNQWSWIFDNNNIPVTTQNATVLYASFGEKHISLAVSNGVCTDTASVSVVLDHELKAAFEAPELLCPEDEAVFKNNSSGKIISWYWDFGNGKTSTLQNPFPFHYQPEQGNQFYRVQLVVQNDLNCFDTASRQIKVLNNCYIAVPSAFTPNNDGLNDFLYPLNAYKADQLIFNVYNRFGQLVFSTRDWMQKWDGRYNGEAQPSGTYVWTLNYVEHDTGKKISRKGTSVLIR